MRPAIIEREIKRSLALHRAVIKRLREDPQLWDVPLANIERWTLNDDLMPVPYQAWKEILTTWEREDILKLMLSRSERAVLLRKSTPFTGILDQETRNEIFEKYKFTRYP